MALFYASDITDTTKTYTLSEEESKHCIRVLRKKKDDEIELVNGKGGQFFALICDAHEKRCQVEITRTIFHSPSKSIHIGLAPTKNMDRIEWFVEKATELGLTKLSFLSCTNNERTAVKLERVNKIAIGAMKQSKRFYLPEICELIPFNLFVTNNPGGYIGHCYESEKQEITTLQKDAVFLIGPEGDFTEKEVQHALENDYTAIALSTFRLRTETAALTAVFGLNAQF
jgi:16S rRNA (uracil1498-N3)-methyltransferase